MEVELQATCSALGYLEADQYHKEPDCLETVKDLILYLKREDESCDIRRQLGEAQIMQNDLIPIVKEYKDDSTLLDAVLRLMVNLTQPALLCFKNNIPEDKTNRNFYLEIVNQLQSYKQAFADEALFAVLTKKLGDLLQLDWEHRQEEDRLLIERMLILVRNILHVPPDPQAEKRTDDDATIHDQVLWALHVSGMEDLLLYISSSEEERQYCLHVLEIISLMFREQTPEQLASAGLTRSLSEREKDQRELESVRELEKAQKKAQILKYSTRHSRFGGTFTVSNMKSISNKDLIYHRSLGNVNEHSFDYNKTKRKRPKNRRPIKEVDVTRRSTLSIRMFLRDFCVQFLENCYNPLMYSVKDILVRSKAQDNDETYQLWSMRFFMEFSRLYKFRIDVISETLSVPNFHYVHTQLVTYHDMMLTNKKEGIAWSKRMHLTVKAYYELLQTVQAMDKSSDPQLMESAKVIKSNVFYVMEYRDIFITLLKKFDETRQSREYLRDLVECVHLYVKMLEGFCKSQSHFMVQKKRKKSQKKKKKQSARAPGEAEFSQEQLDDMWDEVSSDLSAILQGRGDIPEDVTPFDAASEVDVDQQRIEAVIRIQDALREQRAGEAIAILRAAREVWPDRDDFGQADIAPEEEFMALREMFMTNLPRPNNAQPQDEEMDDQEEDNEIEEEERESVAISEQEFEMRDFILRFAHHQIVRSYALLLMDFEKYSPVTNHCCVKMLHRIAYECKAIGMLFQMSLFRIFKRLLCDPIGKSKRYLELATFAKYIVRRFFEVAQTNSKVFMEILFWKGIRESIEINEGYGSYKANHSKGPNQLWTEEQDEELKFLWERYRDNAEGDVVDQIMVDMSNQNRTRRAVVKQLVYLGMVESSADLKKGAKKRPDQIWSDEHEQELIDLFHRYKDCDEPGVDAVDQIVAHLSDNSKTRRHVVKHLTQLGLISGAADLKKNRSKGSNRVWLEEQQVELQQLYEQYKSSDDPLGNIISCLLVKRSRQKVTEKLLEMGLVKDKSELYKRRRSKKKKKDGYEEDIDDEDDLQQEREHFEEPEELLESEHESEDDQSSSAPCSDEEENSELSAFGLAVVKMARKLRMKGFENQIKWISDTLKSTADDREEDGDTEPVPVVSLTEEHDNALEDKAFKRLLKKVGLKPPDNQQERFWRIPGPLAPSDLRCRADYLMNMTSGAGNSKKTSNSRVEALQSLAKNRKKEQKAKDKDVRHKRRSAAQVASHLMNDSSTDLKNQQERASSSKKSRVKRAVQSGSDESDDERLVIDEEESNDTTSNKRTRNEASDDDNTNSQSSIKKSAKRAKINDSDEEDIDVSRSNNKERLNDLDLESSDDETLISVKENASTTKLTNADSSSDSEDDIPLVSSHRNVQVIKKSHKEDDASDEDDENIRNNNNDGKLQNVNENGLGSSDSDSDVPLVSKSRPSSISKHSKSPALESDSDDELVIKHQGKKTEASFPATLMTQQFSDSDSDVEDHIPLKRPAKKNLIESDSE